MTISERMEFLQGYPGQRPSPPGFAEHWRSLWDGAALTGGQAKTVPLHNPGAVCKELTLETAQGSQVKARYLRPALEGKFPLVLLFHDLNRPVRGWHHMTRFLALGYGVLALENRYQRPDWRQLTARELERSLQDALTVAHTALFLPHVDETRLYAWGEGFGGGLAAAAAALLPMGAHCAIVNPCPCDVEDPECALVDCANFGPLLQKPLLMGTGLLDTMASPEGQYALYNRAVCDKTHKVYAKYGHERINFFENESLKFFHT